MSKRSLEDAEWSPQELACIRDLMDRNAGFLEMKEALNKLDLPVKRSEQEIRDKWCALEDGEPLQKQKKSKAAAASANHNHIEVLKEVFDKLGTEKAVRAAYSSGKDLLEKNGLAKEGAPTSYLDGLCRRRFNKTTVQLFSDPLPQPQLQPAVLGVKITLPDNTTFHINVHKEERRQALVNYMALAAELVRHKTEIEAAQKRWRNVDETAKKSERDVEYWQLETQKAAKDVQEARGQAKFWEAEAGKERAAVAKLREKLAADEQKTQQLKERLLHVDAELLAVRSVSRLFS